MRTLLNVIFFQAGWFAAVLSAGKGMMWFGHAVVPVILILHIALSPKRKAETLLILFAGSLGFFIDTLFIIFGTFRPIPYLFPPPFSPSWMVLLWMNFAITINVSLKKLHGHYLLAAILGSIGGPAAYYGGARLGATLTIPTLSDILILSAVWAAAVPVLFLVAEKINAKYS